MAMSRHRSGLRAIPNLRMWMMVLRLTFFFPELFKKGPVKVGGLKPSDLPYARNDKIRVEHLTDEQLKEFEKSVKGWLW